MTNAEFETILQTVREFIAREVIPREEEIEETDAVPDVIRTGAIHLGLFGYALPEEYGGLGLSMVREVRLAFELGRTTPAFRSMFGTNNGIAGQMIAQFGTEEQKERYLPMLCSGGVASFALTEAEAGSIPTGMRTKAVRDGDTYVLTGSKRFITNAEVADVFVVFARTGSPAEGGRDICAFLVDAGADGLTVGSRDQKMGQRGAWSSEVYLDGVRVPASALLGGTEEGGYKKAMFAVTKGRLTIGALCVGMAERIIEEATAYALSNRQGGKPIGHYQLVQAMLAESETEARAGRALALASAAAFDAGTDTIQGPACTKLFCSEMLGRVADRGVQICGGVGYMRSVPIERFYRDARLFRIYEGTSEIQKLVIAREMLSKSKAGALHS
ncbi:MAG: acyl-CoA dehydrogenase family protein [Thermomicrobium sp.]|nr:acyl-CoA dehydrogenase family protein [Thermomicrobium sp.]